MKLLLILGLIINVAGFGEIPAEGLHIELTQAEEDPLTGEMRMDVNGTLLCSSALSVSITRSEAGLEDEFCCADQCTPGNGEQTESPRPCTKPPGHRGRAGFRTGNGTIIEPILTIIEICIYLVFM